LKEILDVNPHCRNFQHLPDISITLKSRREYNNNDPESYELSEIILRPEDYIINGKRIKKILDDNNAKNTNDDLFNDAIRTNNFDCKSAFMSINVPEPRGPILIFGEYFMKKFYTVFDRDQKVLGLSIANQNDFIKNKSQKEKIIKNLKTPYDDIEIKSEKGFELNEMFLDNSNGSLKNQNINKIRFTERTTIDGKLNKDKKKVVAADDVLLVHP